MDQDSVRPEVLVVTAFDTDDVGVVVCSEGRLVIFGNGLSLPSSNMLSTCEF